MNNKKDLESEFMAYTSSLVGSGQITPDLATELFTVFKRITADRETYLVGGLTEKVLKWESVMGDEDKSLYTLGVRHAIDFIRGIEPTNAKQYKPMDDDFRTFGRFTEL